MQSNKKIKVLMASVYPYNESIIKGGVESVAFHLVQALATISSIELHVVSFTNLIDRSREEKRNSVHFHWLKHSLNINGIHTIRFFISDILRLKQVYKKIKPDIYHFQGFAGYVVACRSSDKVVISVHGVEVATGWAFNSNYYKGVKGFIRIKYERFLLNKSIQRANILISNSGTYAPSVLKNNIKNVTIEFIDHPISNVFFQKMTKNIGKKQILCVAGISDRKAQIDLINAVKIVSEKNPVQLKLLGPIVDEQYYKLMIQTINKLGMKQLVIIDTDLSQDKILKALHECTIFILSSKQETAPMAIAAAMASGKPIISTNVGGISSMLKDRVNGYLIPSGDIKLLSDRITMLLSDEEKIVKFGSNSRKIAESKFSTDIIANKTLKVYKNLIGRISEK